MRLRTYFSALLMVIMMTTFASADWILTHHYKLDETTGTTAYDSVGTVNGTLKVASGTAGFSFDDDATAGHIDGALKFTGTDNHIIDLGDDALAVGTNDFKISMWVKRGTIGTRQGLWGQSENTQWNPGSMWARFEATTNLLRFIVDKGNSGSGDSQFEVFSTSDITDTAWHQLEFARTYSAVNNETTYAIYIDGALDNSAVDPGTPYPITGDDGAVFGSYTRTNTNSFDGLIDDIRIYGVPEPSSVVLLCLGLFSLMFTRRR